MVDYAHERGVTVEGEIGVLGGVEDGHGAGGTGLEHITDPDQAVEFAERTGVDALAIAIGTSHGAYKFTKKPDGSVLKMDVLIAIHKRLPHTHLVMHGSSSVPKDLQDIVNQYGGKLKQTWGVPVEEIQLGIRNGVRKINVDTDNRLAITGAIRKVFAETPEKFDPRDYMKPAREAMAKVVAARMTEFGQAGHAGDYKPIPITEMAKGYATARSTRGLRWRPSNLHASDHRKQMRHSADCGWRIFVDRRNLILALDIAVADPSERRSLSRAKSSSVFPATDPASVNTASGRVAP